MIWPCGFLILIFVHMSLLLAARGCTWTLFYILFMHLVVNDMFLLSQMSLLLLTDLLFNINVAICICLLLIIVCTNTNTPLNLAVMALQGYIAVCFPLRHTQCARWRRPTWLLAWSGWWAGSPPYDVFVALGTWSPWVSSYPGSSVLGTESSETPSSKRRGTSPTSSSWSLSGSSSSTHISKSYSLPRVLQQMPKRQGTQWSSTAFSCYEHAHVPVALVCGRFVRSLSGRGFIYSLLTVHPHPDPASAHQPSSSTASETGPSGSSCLKFCQGALWKGLRCSEWSNARTSKSKE